MTEHNDAAAEHCGIVFNHRFFMDDETYRQRTLKILKRTKVVRAEQSSFGAELL